MTNVNTVLNKEFRFVFCPKDKSKYPNLGKRNKFGVGAGQLDKYLGSSNAEIVRRKAMDLTLDKLIVKFRATGRVYIYSK